MIQDQLTIRDASGQICDESISSHCSIPGIGSGRSICPAAMNLVMIATW